MKMNLACAYVLLGEGQPLLRLLGRGLAANERNEGDLVEQRREELGQRLLRQQPHVCRHMNTTVVQTRSHVVCQYSNTTGSALAQNVEGSTGLVEAELGLVEVEVLDEAQRVLVALRTVAEVLVAIVELTVLSHQSSKVLLQPLKKNNIIHY